MFLVDLDKLNLDKKTLEFYADPNNLKCLLIEHGVYKKAFDTQQKNIDDFISKISYKFSKSVLRNCNNKFYYIIKY
jgi:hypothetical protein